MRFAIAIAIVLVATVAWGDAGSYGLIESIAGPSHCAGLTGNGKVTIGIDAAGRVSECRWPGPIAPNQITYSLQPDSHGGAVWGTLNQNTIEWLPALPGPIRTTVDDGGAPIVRTVYESSGVTATAFVVPGRDVAVFQLQYADFPSGGGAVWLADFSPCTENVPGLPGAERLFSARRDLVAFAEDGTVYHARPSGAGTKVWDQAEGWLAGGAEPDWFKKGDAVWIGYTSAERIADAVCGDETGEQSALHFAESGAWKQHEKAVGPAASAARIPIDRDSKSAAIFVAFGERRKDVDAALDAARERGYAGLLEDTQHTWQERLAKARRPAGAAAPVNALYDRALRQLLLNADAQSGAIARAPLTSPPLAVDMPRFTGWTTLALDFAGEADTVARHLRFLTQSVRTSNAPGAPAGSAPAALSGDGREAVPGTVLDLQASAWLLWSIWQHDARVPEADRPRYRTEMWKTVERTGDFVSSYCRAVRDTPVFSFDPAQLSDTSSPETLAVAYAGLRAAVSFAKADAHEKPEWAARAIELEDYLRFHALDAAGDFKVADPLMLWPTDLVAAGDPRWDRPVRAAIDHLQTGPEPETIKTLAAVAMLLRDQKDKLASLQPLVEPVVRRTLDAYPCDSYYAALAVTIVLTVFNS